MLRVESRLCVGKSRFSSADRRNSSAEENSWFSVRDLSSLVSRNRKMPSDSILARMKPPGLQPGDTVGIVAPASNVKRELLQAGCETLRSMGYKPFYFDSILDQDLYFAG